MSVGWLHIIRPEWLLLLPVAVVLWLWVMRSSKATNWVNYLPQKTLEVLRVGQSSRQNVMRWLLLVVWLLLITAAAGPSWIKQSVPALQNQRALIILLDLSPSMLSADVTPNRVTRARFKLIDALRLFEDGQFGLVAYAGSAHIVSPLTDDPETISALVPALSPELMPQQGSNIEAAVTLAQRLLDDAGIAGGRLLLISDGVDENAVSAVSRSLKSQRSLSILGVGGIEPAPIPTAAGGLLRNSTGDIVLTSLNASVLRDLANRTGGRFATLSANDADIAALVGGDLAVNNAFDSSNSTLSSQVNQQYDSWADMGYIFVLLALPLFILLFRKGAVYLVMIGVVSILAPLTPKAEAAESSWLDLFSTKDQQASELMQEGRFDEAANTFERNDWSAAAHYRDGNYEAAIEQLQGREDTVSAYNRANALAMSGKLPEAIESYEQLLKQNPEHVDAAHNKKVLEELLKQQEQQQQQGQNQDQENKPNSKNSEQQDAESSQSKDQQASEQQADQQQSGEQSQQQESDKQNGDPSKQNQTDNDGPNEDESDPNQSGADDTKELSEQHADQSQQEAEQDSRPEPSDDNESQQQAQADAVGADAAPEPDGEPQSEQGIVEALEETETLSADSEQWLRGIEDDPSGLLRRKFEYQAWQRQQQLKQGQEKGQGNSSSNPSKERY